MSHLTKAETSLVILLNIVTIVVRTSSSAHMCEDVHATRQVHCQWWSVQCHAKHAENAVSVQNTCLDKKLSCRRETTRRFVSLSLNILLSHSRSFKTTLLSRACVSPYYYSIETMSVYRTVSEIFSVKEWRDLETGGTGRSSLLKMALFDRSYTTFCWSAIVSIALSCTVFELFDVE